MNNKIIIIGAGLCGTLLALRLAQRGFYVNVFERRPDMRKATISAGRSINLALSDRGLRGMELTGIKKDISNLLIPMNGRMIHQLDGETTFVNYSGRKGEWINSVSRGELNMLLLNKAEETGKIQFIFNAECDDVDLASGSIQFINNNNETSWVESGKVVFGTDGANSALRNAMLRQSSRYRFDFSQKHLETGYKELQIPASESGGFRMEKNALHIWPRHGFMMIALPNLDGSFTVTLFLPFDGNNSFSKLQTDDQILNFFSTNFSSSIGHMPDLLNDFKTNPSSSLATVKCYPWQADGKYLLMGDAAHAVVPFYGQGMNASFEDVVVLDELIDQFDGDWSRIFPAYQQKRKTDTDAIADLAEENQYEMRAATADPVFLFKRKIELQLEQLYPDYYSKYSLVTFREDIPYSVAMQKGRKQDEILMNYAKEVIDSGKVDYQYLSERLTKA